MSIIVAKTDLIYYIHPPTPQLDVPKTTYPKLFVMHIINGEWRARKTRVTFTFLKFIKQVICIMQVTIFAKIREVYNSEIKRSFFNDLSSLQIYFFMLILFWPKYILEIYYHKNNNILTCNKEHQSVCWNKFRIKSCKNIKTHFAMPTIL